MKGGKVEFEVDREQAVWRASEKGPPYEEEDAWRRLIEDGAVKVF